MTDRFDENFLLSTETARKLYHEYAASMPIVDYHCHVSPREIWEDKRFENIAQLWLSGDHYKWRLMRANGVDERYITGDAPDREKFQKFAELLPRAVGNPMVHWCRMELKNYFGYDGILNGDMAGEIWRVCEEKLKEKDSSVRGLIRKSHVKFIGTTDDPADTLEYHEKLKNDPSFETVVAPTFRPDKALNLEKEGWGEYVSLLSRVAGVDITDLDSMEEALRRRMDRFEAMGCRASDHGLDRAVCVLTQRDEADRVMKRCLAGEAVSIEESDSVKTALLLFCAEEYKKRGWVMQIHYNCMRNPNSGKFRQLGPDTGFDCIGPDNGSAALGRLLNALEEKEALPKLVLYSLDGGDNRFLDTLAGSFQDGSYPGKLQHGSAWWFNDTKAGMVSQLTSLAETGLLGNFIGMLTDSRSFLSYARHEYFRRILCDLVGGWAETGECFGSVEELGKVIQDICYNNAVRYFGLEGKL